MNYGYIYLTTNTFNNHKYIGRHKSNAFEPAYKGSGIRITEAIAKYGKDAFEMV